MYNKPIYHKIYLDNHPELVQAGIVDIPREYVIHHIDFNHDNNEPDNLQLMTRSEHAKIHNATRDWSRFTEVGKSTRYQKGHTVSEEQRKHHSELMKGRPSWNKGRVTSPATIAKMARALKGRVGWNKGVPMSIEAKRKSSESHKGQQPGNIIPITQDMINDYKSGMSRKDWMVKYQCGEKPWYRMIKSNTN